MKKILVIFAHPKVTQSKMNMEMRRHIADLKHVTIHDLYAEYPDFLIDVEREQTLVEEHDVIIFQHPFYWYQAPAIIKEWLDLVLEYGWAYGVGGTALQDKIMLQAITAGGGADSYRREGYNRYTIKELTTPFIATANLCKMKWREPFTVLGIHKGLPDEEIKKHTERYREFVLSLRDEAKGDNL